MAAKASLYVTRKLPQAVLDRATRDYDARLNIADVPPGPDGLVAGAAGMDAITMGIVISWAMETFEKGIFKKEDFKCKKYPEGFELRFYFCK